MATCHLLGKHLARDHLDDGVVGVELAGTRLLAGQREEVIHEGTLARAGHAEQEHDELVERQLLRRQVPPLHELFDLPVVLFHCGLEQRRRTISECLDDLFLRRGDESVVDQLIGEFLAEDAEVAAGTRLRGPAVTRLLTRVIDKSAEHWRTDECSKKCCK